jgi:pimeloyl-ACP methyl ester carboxylesterase
MTTRRALPATLLVAIAILVVACGTASPQGTWILGKTPTAAPSASPSASALASASAGASSSTPSSSPPSSASPSAGASPSASPAAAAPNDAYSVVATKPCPASRFTCTTLAVAKDHYAAPGGPTWNVTFAIQHAAKERKGTFVVIVGGPGGSGILSADGYTDYYGSAITDSYDIVFIDQRGIGQSGEIQCINAAAAYYGDPNLPEVPAERPAAEKAAQTFATDCVAEAGIAAADLPLYGTRQAIEDLEAIRSYLGVDKLDLYGESYGTQFVQTYAAAYPAHIAALFVDGPVDLTVDGIRYYVESTRSAEDTFTTVLRACTADKVCSKDVKGGDALAAYDTLREAAEKAPLAFDYPMGDGTTQHRTLSSADLQNAAFGYIYSPGDREPLERAVASASHGDLVPMAKLAYDSIGVDPDTLKAEVDPTWSDAMYYAVECQDYAFYPNAGDPDARLSAWLKAGADAGIDAMRVGSSFYGDVPCLYWPSATTSDVRPAPLVDTPYPVFVLTSTTDPATPIVGGYRIYSRLNDAYFFQTLGGPHVIYGWGEDCPDTIISDYLAKGTLPAVRITTCAGNVATDYVGNAPQSPSDFKDALALMRSMDDQLLNTDDYLYRVDKDPVAVGCDFGGRVTYTPTDKGTTLALDGCAFVDGVAMTGSGVVDSDAGTLRLTVTIGGDPLEYRRDADGGTRVKGTYQGRKIDLKAAA